MAKKQVLFKRAETYVKEYREKEREVIEAKRAARASGDFYVEGQPRLYFVIRLRGYVNAQFIFLRLVKD